MDDDQFQGGLSDQGGSPVSAQPTDTNLSSANFGATPDLGATSDFGTTPDLGATSDLGAVDTTPDLGGGPDLGTTPDLGGADLGAGTTSTPIDLGATSPNVNISSSSNVDLTGLNEPTPEPEGPISEMSRRMDAELGNITDPSANDISGELPESPVLPDAPVAAETSAAAPTETINVTPQVLGPEPVAAPAPDANVEQSAMSFETTAIPGQAPAAPASDIPAFTGESRPSVPSIKPAGKKTSPTMIILVVVLLLAVVATVAIFIIPNLMPKKSSGGSSNNNNSSQNTNNTPTEDDTDDVDTFPPKGMKVVGTEDHGYVVIPTAWVHPADMDASRSKWVDAKADFGVYLDSADKTSLTALDYANYQLEVSKNESDASTSATLAIKETTLGSYKKVYKIAYLSNVTNKWTVKLVFESAKRTHYIMVEGSNEDSNYFTTIPNTFDLTDKTTKSTDADDTKSDSTKTDNTKSDSAKTEDTKSDTDTSTKE